MSTNSHTPLSDLEIEHRFAELREVPARDPLRAASARARFLREASEYHQAVSPASRVRHIGWIFRIRKEKLSMNVLVSLILAASLLLGGGATVAAAQDDLPTQSLYQLKLWSENATLAMQGDPQEQAALLMVMAQTRLQEMVDLVDMGITPPDQVRDRLQEHLNQALKLADELDEPVRDQVLLQLHDQLQTQDRIMEQLQTHANTETEPLLTQTRQMLQLHLQLVDQDLAESQEFQYMLENQMQYGQDEEAIPEPNQQGEPGFHQNGPDEQPGTVPGTGNDSAGGPNTDTPQGGNNGSNPGNQEPSGPNSPNGNGSGSGNGTGPGTGGGNK